MIAWLAGHWMTLWLVCVIGVLACLYGAWAREDKRQDALGELQERRLSYYKLAAARRKADQQAINESIESTRVRHHP